jgi:RNase H-fold protein (predicted Holliday junction resolvase)
MILGLDISTTVIGVALIDDQGNLALSEHWDILSRKKRQTIIHLN